MQSGKQPGGSFRQHRSLSGWIWRALIPGFLLAIVFGPIGAIASNSLGRPENTRLHGPNLRGNQYPRAMAVRSNGTTAVAATTTLRNRDRSTEQGALLSRIGSTGKVDRAFGDHGFVFYNAWRHHDESPMSVAIQRDGRIVVAGWVDYTETDSKDDPWLGFFVLRLHGNGRIDRSFGRNGRIIGRFAKRFFLDDSGIVKVAVLKNDQIMLAGRWDDEFVARKFTRSGKKVRNYGIHGRARVKNVILEFSDAQIGQSGEVTFLGYDVAKTADGRLRYECVLSQLSSGGDLQGGFGTNGISIISSPGGDQSFICDQMVLVGDNLVVVGRVFSPHSPDKAFGDLQSRALFSVDASTGAWNGSADRFRQITDPTGNNDVVVPIRRTSGEFDLVASRAGCNCLDILRFKADLTTDTAFGTDGTSSVPTPGRGYGPIAGRWKSDELRVLGGARFTESRDDVVLTRVGDR